jgi:hypothetical protein
MNVLESPQQCKYGIFQCSQASSNNEAEFAAQSFRFFQIIIVAYPNVLDITEEAHPMLPASVVLQNANF